MLTKGSDHSWKISTGSELASARFCEAASGTGSPGCGRSIVFDVLFKMHIKE